MAEVEISSLRRGCRVLATLEEQREKLIFLLFHLLLSSYDCGSKTPGYTELSGIHSESNDPQPSSRRLGPRTNSD